MNHTVTLNLTPNLKKRERKSLHSPTVGNNATFWRSSGNPIIRVQAGTGHLFYLSKSLEVCFWNLLPGTAVACQAFFGLLSYCCKSVHLPQGEEWKINEELRKAHLQGYRDWEGNGNGKWRQRFKLSARSAGKSYKWGVSVNIPTQKWKTTKELFREGLDLNYNHPGQSSLWFIHRHPLISAMPKPAAIWLTQHRPGLLESAFPFHEKKPCILTQMFFLLSCLDIIAYQPYKNEGKF